MLILKHVIPHLLIAVIMLQTVNGLWFFMEPNQQACFEEDVPKDQHTIGYYDIDDPNYPYKSAPGQTEKMKHVPPISSDVHVFGPDNSFVY